MIATLSGTITEKLAESVVIEVQGVGYGILMPLEDYSRVLVGDSAKIYIYEHIRENAHDLYGFVKLDTKKLFEQLLDVTGVGPKMALNVLGVGSAEAVRQAIAAGDTKFIQSATGVGKKVAERIVVELKDKVGLVSTADPDALFVSSAQAEQDEAVQGLLALGYSLPDAVKSLANIDVQLPAEDRIRQALKGTKL
jgi:Holliday junction DNA helicase RuvA